MVAEKHPILVLNRSGSRGEHVCECFCGSFVIIAIVWDPKTTVLTLLVRYRVCVVCGQSDIIKLCFFWRA